MNAHPMRPQSAAAAALRIAAPEIWAGVECSVVRVGDDFRDQAAETGHAGRLADLDLVAGLGIRTMRYPVVWERVAPDDPETCDWRWSDERLGRLRELGVNPIVGLVHHGNGPRYTDLIDPAFPEKLASYARKVAERYPWVRDWTPVNEPLTTARFACLYGLWYPHRRDLHDFARAAFNQCRGVALAMRAIREIIPDARLIQTEDMGKTFSTPGLRYQAGHENERRWLSLDLLAGRVEPGHPWHAILRDAGIGGRELAELQAGEGRPDILGINHYLTSDRFLDERTALYPLLPVGGNGRHAYVDIEAVRAADVREPLGHLPRLREVWQRYRLPLAITEAHNSCTREEQLRWFMEAWDAACALRAEGADMRAVTLWSIFGAVDWCSLLTRRANVVEPGLFCFRGAEPRRTLVAAAAASLASQGAFSHPVLDRPGWWRREDRFLGAAPGRKPLASPGPARPLLITGATGTLGRAFARICAARGLDHVLTSRSELNICEPDSIAAAIDRHRPWAIINTAGFVRVPEAERMPDICFRENAHGPERLAAACAARGLPLVTFSSDLVFDGQAGRPYVEDDEANPLCVYGASKREAERRVAGLCPASLVIRTSAFFGPWDRYNFVHAVRASLGRGEAFRASASQIVSPTYVPDLVNAALDLLLDGETGLWHVATPGEISWFDLAREAAGRAGLDARLVMRPEEEAAAANTALSSSRAVLLRPLEAALAAYSNDLDLPEAA